MEKIYLRIWELAKPYYRKCRPYDISQVEWMMKQADRVAGSVGADKKLLMPVIILHDIGYCVVEEQNPNFRDKVSKKIHMREGARIARKILEQVSYNPELTEKIVHYVSVHDNWLFEDDKPFKESKEMALFNDLDFLHALSDYWVFKLHGDSMGKSPKELHEFWSNDEKLKRRPFCCQETRRMFDEFMADRKHDIKQQVMEKLGLIK